MKLFFFVLTAMFLAQNSASYAFQGGGPNNYYSQEKESLKYLKLVEGAHLKPAIDSMYSGKAVYVLQGGKTGTVYHDLDFVLRWYPNHPKGLLKMAEFLDKFRGDRTIPHGVSIEKYFNKAFQLYPTDATARFIHAITLHKKDKHEDALKEYKHAAALGLDNAEFHYNIGLLYFEMNDLEQSTTHAKKAYSLGYPLPGLQNKLQERGKW